MEDIWKTQSQGKLPFADGSNHSCGVMILVRSDLHFSLKSVNLDIEGRSIIMEAEVQGSLFLFVNIYAPNKVQDQRRFFEDLNQNIEGFVVNKEHRIIVGGDFNVTLDSDFDCSGGKSFGKISAEVPTLIIHSFCYSNSIRFWNRVSMKVMHV